MVLTQEFFNHLVLFLCLMYGMTAFKIADCKPFKEDGEAFDWKKLLIGTSRQLIVISGVMVVFFGGCKCGEDLMLVQIGGSKLTMQGAVDIAVLAVVAYYAAKFVNNFLTFCGLKEADIKPVYPGENKECCCNHGKLIGYVYEAVDGSCEGVCADPVEIEDLVDAAIVAPEGEIN